VLILGLAAGGIYALVASGMTLVWAVTRQINMGHGDFFAILLFGCYSLYLGWGLDPYLSVFITTPLIFGVGLLIFRFLFQPLMAAGPVAAFIAFLGLAFALENALSMRFGADYFSSGSVSVGHRLTVGSVIIPVPHLIAFLGSVLIALGFHHLLRRTDFGRSVRAVAQNPELSSLMGVDVMKLQMVVFGLAFVLLGVAASLVAPIWPVNAYMGLQFTLFAFIVLTLGGMGNFLGALVAGLFIGVLEALSTYFFGPALAPTFPYICFIVVLLFRPTGLFTLR
jgi:branched-chain amino acid transport system permease protein